MNVSPLTPMEVFPPDGRARAKSEAKEIQMH